jgi:hypothetical protein
MSRRAHEFGLDPCGETARSVRIVIEIVNTDAYADPVLAKYVTRFSTRIRAMFSDELFLYYNNRRHRNRLTSKTRYKLSFSRYISSRYGKNNTGSR